MLSEVPMVDTWQALDQIEREVHEARRGPCVGGKGPGATCRGARAAGRRRTVDGVHYGSGTFQVTPRAGALACALVKVV